MQIRNITYINFRNLENSTLEFHPRFNLFLGKNGQGKTSLLEAIYFAVSGKSFRTKTNKEMVNYNKISTGSVVNYEDKRGKKSYRSKAERQQKDLCF